MFHNNIYYSDSSLLDPSLCESLISDFENDPLKHEGYVGGNGNRTVVNQTLKKSTDLFITSLPEYEHYHHTLMKHTLQALEHYESCLEEQSPSLWFKFHRKHTSITGFNVQRTDSDGYFHWHSDDYIESNGYHRGIAYIWYLNTVHEGGTTEFYDGTIIQPKQGHILLFPSTWTYIHRGVPPVNQLKYIITGWWCCAGSVHYDKRLISA